MPVNIDNVETFCSFCDQHENYFQGDEHLLENENLVDLADEMLLKDD